MISMHYRVSSRGIMGRNGAGTRNRTRDLLITSQDFEAGKARLFWPFYYGKYVIQRLCNQLATRSIYGTFATSSRGW